MAGLDFLYGGLGAADAITNLVAQRNFEAQQQKAAAAAAQQQDFTNRLLALKTTSEAADKFAAAQKAGQPEKKAPLHFTGVTPPGMTGAYDVYQDPDTGGIVSSMPMAATPKMQVEAKPVVDANGKWIGNGTPSKDFPGGIDVGDMHYMPTEARFASEGELKPIDPDEAKSRTLDNTKKALDIQKLQSDLAMAQQGGALGTDPGAVQGLHGDPYLQTLNPAQAAKIKALSEGRLAFPTSRSMSQPLIQQLINQVAQYDPTFDAVNYQSRQKTREDFTSGQSAKTINALNTAVNHLSLLSDAVDALGNTSIQPLNTIKNYVSQKTGGTAITNYNTTLQPVAEELRATWNKAGGSEHELQQFLDTMQSSGAPQQLHGSIAQFGHLLQGKINSLQSQYQQGMGTTDIQMLTPQAQKTLDMLEQKAIGGASVQPSGTPEGAQQPIPGIPGGIAEYRNGKWIRIK